ncbi:hypothetical protein L218DRAFT_909265 [Marasmius fiardii PR-910]|nr:hypothetical protein L218DRAFT_909265 [Marasmius fiardii PR-910]
MHVAFVTLALVMSAAAVPRPLGRRAPFTQKNGEDAIALNDKFKGLKADSPCNAGEDACVNDQFAQCVGGKFVLQPCAATLICAALPLVNSAGTSVTCTTAADRDARIAATGATAGAGGANPPPANPPPANPPPANPPPANQGGGQNNAGNNGGGAAGGDDPQKSTTLDPAVIQKTSQNDGTQLDGGAGAVPSIVSANNFINFCKNFLPNTPITDGKQVESGSCNPTPMGQIPAKAAIPHSKFQFPVNFAKVEVNKAFTIQMSIANMQTGFFTNAKNNYYSGPQQLNDQGQIKGHSHVVIQKIDSFTSTALVDPTKFVFFLGLNNPAEGNILNANVDKGIAEVGFYRLASINAAANHQPVLAPIAQHGSVDDIVYFEVTAAGAAGDAAAGGAGGAAQGAAAAKAPAPAPPKKA